MTAILDQQFIVHLYAPAQGPDAEAAYHALQEIWTGCRLVLRMSEPVPGTGLPHFLPPDPAELAGGSNGGGEVALAAQERPAADCQAILRRHHDLLNLSVALAPPEASAPDGADWPWWQALDRQWTALTADRAAHLLGEARLYLARVDARDAVHHADPALIDRLAALLPESARGLPGAQRGVPIGDGLAFWETSTQPDERPLRRFVLALAPDADSAASGGSARATRPRPNCCGCAASTPPCSSRSCANCAIPSRSRPTISAGPSTCPASRCPAGRSPTTPTWRAPSWNSSTTRSRISVLRATERPAPWRCPAPRSRRRGQPRDRRPRPRLRRPARTARARSSSCTDATRPPGSR